MNKTININPLGALSVFSFIGFAIAIFFHKIGNLNLLACIIASCLLLGLGIVSGLAAKNGDNNPALKAIFQVILIVLSAIFVLSILGAVMLALSGQ
jgi:hypothetical protein